MNRYRHKIILKFSFIFFLCMPIACTANLQRITITDLGGIMSETNSPIFIETELNENLKNALSKGQLALIEISDNNVVSKNGIPVQLDSFITDNKFRITFFMPHGRGGIRNFKLVENEFPEKDIVEVKTNLDDKQYLIKEGNSEILQYNYQLVYEDDVVRPESKKGTEIVYHTIDGGVYYEEYLRANPQTERNDTTKSSIYAVPRSDYIHPLYGLNGEILTCDWPDGGHPHHRGIFWAWPEVEYKSEYGDIYALQRVFARPTGNIVSINGPVFAEIKAENLWMWEDELPIVTENVTIRAYRSYGESRIIDLTISLQAIEDSVSIATRFTNSYGGLNVRMQTPKEQQIYHFTDIPESDTIRAWAGFNGIFEGNIDKSGLMILQNKDNPEYPGEWIDYPNLSWVQPTFPTPETKYYLSQSEPLVLKYRLIVHSGDIVNENISIKKWDAYNISTTTNYK